MYENDYMYAIERNDDYLAHYGIRGMKWGVRKAARLMTLNDKASQKRGQRLMNKQYAKAQKKLAKLEKRAASGKKYARRAAALGAGAAAAGGLAALGTNGIVNVMGGMTRATQGAGKALMRFPGSNRFSKAIRNTGVTLKQTASANGGMTKAMGGAAGAIRNWGNSNTLAKRGIDALGGIERANQGVAKALINTRGSNAYAKAVRNAGFDLKNGSTRVLGDAAKNLRGVSNNTIARIGAGAIGAGLAGAAGYNAYRAATTKRAAKKAAQFRKAMNESFRGTQYANGGAPRQGKKRRRR